MIQANELRIGNYVKISNSEEANPEFRGTYYQIESGDFADIENHCKHIFEPIPLTEELLLKCGFENINGNLIIEGVAHIHIGSNREYLFDIKDINYLHQLQNLFFSITGKELEIKL